MRIKRTVIGFIIFFVGIILSFYGAPKITPEENHILGLILVVIGVFLGLSGFLILFFQLFRRAKFPVNQFSARGFIN